ncbi:GNAT family N-acetyltransferase [Lactobacillus xylocopicola]|uniref:N-acetyltransferase n=1 Tax=Lactobacillus xylocopicola TaxID=2976676 RepID=A0ABM8BG47_9LACO|nr:GNAT family N-acetyltransferase [Lactobacillus xylocopicola]BDR60081.1 N-acetyltransferase [Lactobacillus xylocopicola]
MIRKARVSDAAAICQLNQTQLGYDYPLAQTTSNLERLLADDQHQLLLVYEDDATAQVAGYVHAELYEETYFEPMLNVLALAVASQRQQQGIGSQLMQAVEERARRAGLNEVRLNSGAERTVAHHFYEQRGYHCSKQQKRFGKKLR